MWFRCLKKDWDVLFQATDENATLVINFTHFGMTSQGSSAHFAYVIKPRGVPLSKFNISIDNISPFYQ